MCAMEDKGRSYIQAERETMNGEQFSLLLA
jgi:hypothetical protein